MLSNVHPPEIDHRTMKLIVGLIALTLANLTSFFAGTSITSISASYYEGGWSQAIFIGFLFAIAAFLLAYNGYNRIQMVLSKIAAVAAACVALFPCDCDGHPVRVKHVHGASAAVLFIILAVFCYIFFRRAASKGGGAPKARALIYAICGLIILAAVLVLAADFGLHGRISSSVPRLTFYGEKVALLAFAVSWLAASHYLPAITTNEEKRARRVRTHSIPNTTQH
jgi:hypothetical protein